MMLGVLKALLSPLTLTGRVTVWSFVFLQQKAPALLKWMRGHKEAGTLGNAGFATLKELEGDGHLKPPGFLYGVKDGRRVFGKPEACVHFFGKRGEGKSQFTAANINYFAQQPVKRTFITNDAAGEHYRAMWPILEKAGYDLLLMDLGNPRGKTPFQTTYYPLLQIVDADDYSRGRMLRALARSIVSNTGESNDSKHFIEAAAGLLTAFCDWEVQNKGKDASLIEAIRMLVVASEGERDAQVDLIKEYGSKTAKAGINLFLRVGVKERGSFNSTLVRKLEAFTDLALEEMCQPGDSPWTWDNVWDNPKPVAVFIVGGLGFEEVSGVFVRLAVEQAVQSIQGRYNTTGHPLSRPVAFLLDETASLGRCKAIDIMITQLRKAGVTAMMMWQSIGQVNGLYGERDLAPSILDNCDWVITGGSKNDKLYGTSGSLMGDYTTKTQSESESEHGGSKGKHEAARKLMKVDEMKALPWGKAVILADRRNILVDLPFKIEKGKVRYL